MSQFELQKKTVNAFKDQVTKLKALLEACSSENDKMSRELAERNNNKVENEYKKTIEDLRKELTRERNEKDRLRMEKEVQEKLTKKLNDKISVFLYYYHLSRALN